MAIRINLLFLATPEQLFDAWTKKELVEQWLYKNEKNTIRADIDPIPGGKLSIHENDEGQTIDHVGAYVQVKKPDLLTFTLRVPQHFEGETRVSVKFKPTAVGTEMNFVQVGVEASVVEPSWHMMFQNLTILLLKA